jgi:hypothetical protein
MAKDSALCYRIRHIKQRIAVPAREIGSVGDTESRSNVHVRVVDKGVLERLITTQRPMTFHFM